MSPLVRQRKPCLLMLWIVFGFIRRLVSARYCSFFPSSPQSTQNHCPTVSPAPLQTTWGVPDREHVFGFHLETLPRCLEGRCLVLGVILWVQWLSCSRAVPPDRCRQQHLTAWKLKTVIDAKSLLVIGDNLPPRIMIMDT